MVITIPEIVGGLTIAKKIDKISMLSITIIIINMIISYISILGAHP